MFRRARPIRFVFAEDYRQSGSTIMRGIQLAEIARESMPDRDIRLASLDDDLRRCHVFLTKGALKAMTMPRLEALRARDNVLYFDLLDEAPSPITRDYADVVVAASITAFLDLSRDYPHLPVHLVNHHVDPRVAALKDPSPTDRFRPAYFGERVNAVLTPEIEARVDIVHIDTSRESSAWIDLLPEYNFHYAVRAERELDHHKPFTKGFTAAHRWSNVLIQRSQAEALHWLGSDYPYLIDGELSEERILLAMEGARGDFGGERWKKGLEHMRDIRERTMPRRIGGEVRALFALTG